MAGSRLLEGQADLGASTLADALRPVVTDISVLDGVAGEQPNVRLSPSTG